MKGLSNIFVGRDFKSNLRSEFEEINTDPDINNSSKYFEPVYITSNQKNVFHFH